MEQFDEQYYDLRQLSKYSSMGVSTLREYLRRRPQIPHFKLNGKILVKRSEFDAWMENFRANDEADINTAVDAVLKKLGMGKR